MEGRAMDQISVLGALVDHKLTASGQYAPYCEAWDLLRSQPGAAPSTIAHIEACAYTYNTV
jgi:hypothetical protein